MSGITKEAVMKYAQQAGLVTLGTDAVHFVSKKAAGDSLGIPMTGMGNAQLALGVGLGTGLVEYLESKNYIPKE